MTAGCDDYVSEDALHGLRCVAPKKYGNRLETRRIEEWEAKEALVGYTFSGNGIGFSSCFL